MKKSLRRSSLEHVYFFLVGEGRVCAVTKLLLITLYLTVIMIKKGSTEKKRKRERVLNSKLGPYLALNATCMLLD